MFEKERVYNKKRVIVAVLTIMAFISIWKGCVNGLGNPVDFLYNNFKDALNRKPYSGPQFPSTFLFVFWLGLFSYGEAKIIWLICNLVFTVILIFCMRKTFFACMDRIDFTILILIMISGAPWRTNLSNGQYTLCAAAFFILAWYLSGIGKPYLSGFMLSLSIFKYQLTVPLILLFLYRRKYREIVSMCLVQIVAFIISLIWWQGDVYNLTLGQLKMCMTDLADQGYVDIGAFIHNGWISIGIAFVIMLSILIILIRASWLSCAQDIEDIYIFSFLLMIALCIVYHRMYDFFLLIVPLEICRRENIKVHSLMSKIMFGVCLIMVAMSFWGITAMPWISTQIVRLSFYAIIVYNAFLVKRILHDNKPAY